MKGNFVSFGAVLAAVVLNAVVGQQCGEPNFPDIMDLAGQFINGSKFPKVMLRRLPFRSQRINRPWERIVGVKAEQNKIVGGYDIVDVTGGQICWQVRILILVSDRGISQCGGTIVGPRTIVTAGHCVTNRRGKPFEPKSILVLAGGLTSGYIGLPTFDGALGCARPFLVSNVTVHPDYSTTVGNNDIALLNLMEPMDFRLPCVCPLCLDDRVPKPGEYCVASGFGLEHENGTGDRKPIPLRWAYLQVAEENKTVCSFRTETDAHLFICAGLEKGVDTCQGDSGGPLACWNPDKSIYYLGGVTSFGDGCGRGIGGQYTKVARYLSWINSTCPSEAVAFV